MANIKNTRIFLITPFVAGFVFLLSALTGPARVFSQPAFSQGYEPDGKVQTGMIVRLKENDGNKVQALSSEQADQMHGVAVDPNDAPVTLSTSEGEKVFVATAGRFDVLVSDQNGAVKNGDYITISTLRGIGMKAGASQPIIVGRALTNFTKNTTVGSTTVKNSDNKEKKVTIGRVVVDISVSRNPIFEVEEPNVPDYLRRISETVAGKPVPATRVYAGVVIFLISTSISLSLLYGGVRSAIISIGRNPLSKKFIVRGMMKVIMAGLIIFLLGIFAVYLLLKL